MTTENRMDRFYRFVGRLVLSLLFGIRRKRPT